MTQERGYINTDGGGSYLSKRETELVQMIFVQPVRAIVHISFSLVAWHVFFLVAQERGFI